MNGKMRSESEKDIDCKPSHVRMYACVCVRQSMSFITEITMIKCVFCKVLLFSFLPLPLNMHGRLKTNTNTHIGTANGCHFLRLCERVGECHSFPHWSLSCTQEAFGSAFLIPLWNSTIFYISSRKFIVNKYKISYYRLFIFATC